MALESITPDLQQRHYQQHQSHQQHYPHNSNNRDDTSDTLKQGSIGSFYGSTSSPPSLTSMARQPALYSLSTPIPSPVRIARYPTIPDHPSPKLAPTRGPNKPLTLQQQTGTHISSTGAHPSPHSPHFRSQHHVSSLPSPPLSSAEPTHNSGFFLKSPLQDRCEALETELSSLRLKLKQSEQSSTVREKRLSLFQQQSSDAQQSLQTTTLQYESTFSELRNTHRKLSESVAVLTSNEIVIQNLESTTQDQKAKIDEMLAEREAMTIEMKESYAENAKINKRLKASTEKTEKLQQENRQLIEQLEMLKSMPEAVTQDTSDEKNESDDKHKAEIDRLQILVLMMSNRHVQMQAQLTFFQQKAQQLQLHLDQSHPYPFPGQNNGCENKSPELQWNRNSSSTLSTPVKKHGSLMMDESTLTSLLTSVASVAATSPSRRTKPTRRFTVNAPRKDGELTLEQRKCEFLMDQISALQRGYDTLRQEKVTLELQIDLMQRQHQYHQQQRQKRRESQGRTIGHEQSKSLSNALAIMVASPVSSGISALSPVPATPLLPTISAAEQEREKARIQYELEQAQIRAQRVAQEKEAQKLAAKAAAEEAEREAIRLRRVKSLHLKETLASLESKTDNRNVQFSSSEELKHLEQFRLVTEEQQRLSSESSKVFSNAATIRASRRIVSPFSPGNRLSPASLSPLSPMSLSSNSPSSLSNTAVSSPLSSHSLHERQHTKYTPSSRQQASNLLHSHYTYDIEQCSCCFGTLIEI
ncbi:hypothetical protein BGZ76_006840 [Entomortierella beljakovae]|nr:hypothetical protein BGZ76_006840 [Entomortierella beljakovae]